MSKVEVDLSAACAARPDDGPPGVVQDMGQADEHQGAAGVTRGEGLGFLGHMRGQFLQEPGWTLALHREWHHDL
ncbi:hypothetical protein BC739_009080 [Kutzneria viridogrisea]|uniref:Uncharacterized protein n=1 Tax=Kutzneria viridogrisea TaxID=47990 RepID=A0ABR6BCB2_9PSEU|nr:hypothetical protein [Kutzneria viridogrisea]MBA8931821.1 hypothetical protein [Kutzneria viridogrisea]